MPLNVPHVMISMYSMDLFVNHHAQQDYSTTREDVNLVLLDVVLVLNPMNVQDHVWMDTSSRVLFVL